VVDRLLMDVVRLDCVWFRRLAFLDLAGVWRDDPDIEQIVRDANRRRGRTGVELER
jgi:hypothetical protein